MVLTHKMTMAEDCQMACLYNVGGCFFSIPFTRLCLFQDSLLFKHAKCHDHSARFFIDSDGSTFRHVHYYMHTGKLSVLCTSEVNMLYNQASGLQLTALQRALDNLRSGKHFLRARPVNIEVTEEANYWKTRTCYTKLPEAIFPVSAEHDSVPLGLFGTPLLDRNEEVHYCFLPLELVRRHPGLVTEDNLLWLCEDVAVIECPTRHFRFLANFLRGGKILLPEQFTDYESLLSEADILGIAECTEAIKHYRGVNGVDVPVPQRKVSESPSNCTVLLLYVLTFDLLVKYPDSSLGELYVESNLDDSKMYMTGTGIIFQHVENWLGTRLLPLTEMKSQLYGMCEYLNRQDGAYLAFREALWQFFCRSTTGRPLTSGPWSASVETVTVYRIVKVFVGTHWYATYLKTLLKHPEFLSNSHKVSWIIYGQSLHVKGDGQMFRHILNFLRCSRLMLPSNFREWPLLCYEIEEFQIPALSKALQESSEYRAWCKDKDLAGHSHCPLAEPLLIHAEDDCAGEIFDQGERDLFASVEQTVNPEDSDNTHLKTSSDVIQNSSIMDIPSDVTLNKSKSVVQVSPLRSVIHENTGHIDVAAVPRGLQNGEPGRMPYWQTDALLDIPTAMWAQHGGNGRGHMISKYGEILELRQSTQTNIPFSGEVKRSRRGLPVHGCVLLVKHPPIMVKGEAGGYFTESVVYTGTAPPADVAFVYFNQSYKEMLYARECHAFLTGILLDSNKLNDSKKCTAKMHNLVYSLWTEQLDAEHFVVELMKMACFKSQKHNMDLLLQWVKYTLPFARRYYECLKLLGKNYRHITILFKDGTTD